MVRFKKNKNGTTLIELTIVLALASIITLSLTLLIDSMSRIANSTEKSENIINNEIEVRTFINNWFSSFDEKDNVISIDSSGNITITKDSKDYKLYKGEDSIIAQYYNSEDETLNFYSIESITFSEIRTKLYKCEIKYMDEEEMITYSFLIARRS